MTETVAVIVAHGDDEVLGCAGTLAKHHDSGDLVHLIVMSDGESSRGDDVPKDAIQAREKSTEAAASILGIQSVTFLEFADNRMDGLDMLSIIKGIERVADQIAPSIVYTHHPGDLNIDHRLTYQGVITACRPLPSSPIRKLLSFEVVSSTEWNWGSGKYFEPNHFVDITSQMERKISALSAYKDEMREEPHARSIENVKALANLRGSTVGVGQAEAFVLQYSIDT